MTTKQTMAERAAKAAGDNGNVWVVGDGETAGDVFKRMGAKVERKHGVGERYAFPDGSAIVALDGGWDIEGSTPWSWQGAE